MTDLPRVGVVCAGVLKEVPEQEKHDFDVLEKLVGANTGNLAFTYPIDRLIDNSIEPLPWNFDIEKARERYDILWFACANMIGSHAELGWVADHLEAAGLPVIAVGLGAQSRSITNMNVSIQPGTLRWLKVVERLSASESNIFCRGEYTDSILKLHHISHSQSGCCPSLFISSNPALGATIFKNRHDPEYNQQPFAVYSGFIGNKSLYPLEQSLARLIDHHSPNGIYISQHGGTLLRLSEQRFHEQLSDNEIASAKTMILPMASNDEFLQWCQLHMRAFYSLDTWIDTIKSYRFACGMRFHGTMVSLQAGTPSLCITIDSRTEEMCKSCMVPSMNAFEFSSVNPSVLYRVFDVRYKAQKFDENRASKAREFISFLTANNLSPSLHLQKIASGSGDSADVPELQLAG
jgi:hypothetical protein